MKKLFLTMVVLAMTMIMPSAQAESSSAQDAAGTWTFFVTINGAPPCQCIQMARFLTNGGLDAPGNDHFTGQGLGEWKKTGSREVTFVIMQNNLGPDGSAAGLYVIRGVMHLNASGDTGNGSSTFQLIDNSGKVLESGTATFRATKLVL